MKLSLTEAARLLNKSERQVRYLIRYGKLPARKVEGRWIIRRQDLPLSEGQEKAAAQKAERAARLAAEVLQPRSEEGRAKGRFSIRQLRAFQTGAPLYQELVKEVGGDHPATELLKEALMLLACGYHEFEAGSKQELYSRARQHTSRAAMALLLDEKVQRDDLVDRFETALLPAIGGLIHQAEKRKKR